MRVLLWYSVAVATIWLLKMLISILSLSGFEQVLSCLFIVIFLPIGYFLWATLLEKNVLRVFHWYSAILATPLIALPILGVLFNPNGFTGDTRIIGFISIAPVVYYLWVSLAKR